MGVISGNSIESIALVGYTGFVGSNIYARLVSEGYAVCGYNSQNIGNAYGTQPDLLIYAGLRAEKFLANENSAEDYKKVLEAEDNIKRINPQKVILISTIDVLKEPAGKTEIDVVETDNLQPYGFNRYLLELWQKEYYPDSYILRLPALYGINIKKNFIYDYLHRVPSMLKQELFDRVAEENPELRRFYILQKNGYYRCRKLSIEEEMKLTDTLERLGISSLMFTDSRNKYQYFPLSKLWNYIKLCIENDIHLLHVSTEPVQVAELFRYLSGEEFRNELNNGVMNYDFKSMHYNIFGGADGYLLRKNEILEDIGMFIAKQMERNEDKVF